MTLNTATSSVPEIGVAMIGTGLMAKSHTMGYRNVEAVFGSTLFRPRFTVLADAREDLARTGAVSLGYERWTIDWREAVTDPSSTWLTSSPRTSCTRTSPWRRSLQASTSTARSRWR